MQKRETDDAPGGCAGRFGAPRGCDGNGRCAAGNGRWAAGLRELALQLLGEILLRAAWWCLGIALLVLGRARVFLLGRARWWASRVATSGQREIRQGSAVGRLFPCALPPLPPRTVICRLPSRPVALSFAPSLFLFRRACTNNRTEHQMKGREREKQREARTEAAPDLIGTKPTQKHPRREIRFTPHKETNRIAPGPDSIKNTSETETRLNI